MGRWSLHRPFPLHHIEHQHPIHARWISSSEGRDRERLRVFTMKTINKLLLALGLIALATPAVAQPAAKSEPAKSSCFYFRQMNGWKAPDAKTVYIRVGLHRYYRLDLAGSCHSLRSPGAFLITKIRGPHTICSAVDWDLHVATSWNDIPQACIVKKMTELTPEEAAALPKKSKP